MQPFCHQLFIDKQAQTDLCFDALGNFKKSGDFDRFCARLREILDWIGMGIL